MRPFGVVILAAGASTRLGRPKQLLPFRGSTLARHAAQTALDAGAAEVIVVLGSHGSDVHLALDELPVKFEENLAWDAGMGGSIASGVAALSPRCESCVLMLVDQPLIPARHLRALAARREELDAPFVATDNTRALGVPCAFGRVMFERLRGLSGDQGARALIRDAPSAASIRLAEAALDVDSQSDLAVLNALEPAEYLPRPERL